MNQGGSLPQSATGGGEEGNSYKQEEGGRSSSSSSSSSSSNNPNNGLGENVSTTQIAMVIVTPNREKVVESDSFAINPWSHMKFDFILEGVTVTTAHCTKRGRH